MTFEVGRLSAALTLDGVQDFHRGLDEAGRKLADTGQRGASFGRAVEAGVRTAAGATVALTAAAGAYLTILAKQGVAYNSMQQNSRAALNVLLGGTEKANEQMAKLDNFARTSPFSKSVFIQAQQQLIGFGMEASKVVPTLDAIQQSVAAMGGSSEDISEITRVLAQVTSTGKFTGITLQQLGVRGVDAATIIGERMGKTGNEIREAITEGAIGGEEALEHLVAGMQDKFGGAADLVKEQWSGAVDRIKAAQRDLGAHLAEPFVSAEGGGMAVTWGNQVADVLRAIEKQAIPVVQILTQRSMPFFSSLTSGLDSAQASIQRWNPSSLEVSLDKMANHAPGIAALVGATIALGAQVGPLGTMLKSLGMTANPVLAAFVGLAAASPELRDALKGLLDAGKPLLPMVGELAVVLSGSLNAAIPLVSSGIEVLTAVLRPVIGLIEKIPTPVLAGALAFLGMQQALKTVEGPLGTVATGIQRFAQQSQVQAALGETSAGVGALSTASMAATGKVTGLGTAMKTAFISNPIGLALTAVTVLISAWAMANAAAQQKVEEHNGRVASLKGTLDETTGALTEASEEMLAQSIATDEMASSLKNTGVSGKLFVTALQEGGAAAQLFESDIMKSAKSMESYDKYSSNWQATADDLGVSLDTLVRSSLGFTDAQEEVDAALRQSGGAFSEMDRELGNTTRGIQKHLSSQYEVVSAYEAQRLAIEEAQREQARMRDATREAAAAMSDAARSNQRFNDALAVARDTTADAETRVRALKQALDELKGGAISAEEAEKRLSETNLTLAEGLAAADEEGKKLWQSTLDGAGAIDLGTRNGLAFADSMGRSRDAMLDAAMAAADNALANGDLAGAVKAAQAAGDGYIETLRQTMTEAGLTAEQINGLIGNYLDVPSVVATLLTDNGSISEVDQQLLALAIQIDSTPDKTITLDEPMSPSIMKRLEALGFKTKTLPDGKIRVSATGIDATDAAINAIANKHRQAWIDVREREAGPRISNGHGGGITRADGGLDVHTPSGLVQTFANGGFPTGIYPGGKPIFKFAEPETGWEAFISGRPGQEARNARIAMDALQRLGFPVVPVSALRGVPAFANGGTVTNSPTPTPAPPQSAAPINVYGHRGMDVDALADAVYEKISGRL